MNDDKDFYTVYEIASRHNVTHQTVYNWIKAGLKCTVRHDKGLKAFRVISDEDVNDFLRSRIEEATKDFV